MSAAAPASTGIRIYNNALPAGRSSTDILDEAALSVSQMVESDACVGYIKHLNVFNAYTMAELVPHIMHWRKLKCKCDAENTLQVELGGSKVWLFIIQPHKLKGVGFCPLALSLGVMVDGFGYIAKDKSVAEFVSRALST
jgi:hypothetical protein